MAIKIYLMFHPFRMLMSLSLFLFISGSILLSAESKDDYRGLTYAYSNNININYEKIGYGEKKVVLLHGFGTSLHTWDDIKELFPKNEFTLYLIDLKGFGNSSKPEDDLYTIQEQSKIVEQFIRDINTDSLYLIGHSFGGGIALLTQISLLNGNSKTRICKLILIDCLAYIQDMPLFMEYLRIPVLNKLALSLPNKYKAEYILNKIFYNKDLINQKLIDRYASFYDADDLDYTFITSAGEINKNGFKNITSDYKKIITPSLIIWGKNDQVLLLDNGIKLSKEMPNATLEVIDQCGHVPQEEKPIVTYKKIYSFITGE